MDPYVSDIFESVWYLTARTVRSGITAAGSRGVIFIPSLCLHFFALALSLFSTPWLPPPPSPSLVPSLPLAFLPSLSRMSDSSFFLWVCVIPLRDFWDCWNSRHACVCGFGRVRMSGLVGSACFECHPGFIISMAGHGPVWLHSHTKAFAPDLQCSKHSL